MSRPPREPARDLALAEAVGRELTLVCAPAGFGKTALLGFWAYRGRRPVAWLSHEGDNDPARFWRYVAAALDQVCEGVGGQVAALLGANRRHGGRRW